MDAKNYDKINVKELFAYLNREIEKLKVVFRKVEFLDKDLEKFTRAYWKDCIYFYETKEYVKAFELVNYIWGILDCMANRNLLTIPEDIKGWFKI